MPEDTPGNVKKSKTKRRARNLLIDLITLFVVIIIAIAVIVIVGQHSSGDTESSTTLAYLSLRCKKSADNRFFDKPTPDSGTAEITANFRTDTLQDLMYTYTATYPADVDLGQTRLHAEMNFDLAYGNRYIYSANPVWTDSFSTNESDRSVRMQVYSKAADIKASAAPAFGLENENIDIFPTNLNSVKSAYETEGYSCQISE